MRVIRNNKAMLAFLKVLKERASGGSQEIELKVKAILDDVRRNGDKAVLRYTKAFDFLKAKGLRIRPDEISGYAGRADAKVVRALKLSAKRIKAFHEIQKEESWTFSEGDATLEIGRASCRERV